MYDFIVIGDILIDRIIRITDSEVLNSIDVKAHTVCLPFPSKMQLSTPPHSGGGGNVYNAAHALQNLGLSTAVFSMVGKDPEGDFLVNDLKSAGINIDMIQRDEQNATNSSFIFSIAGDKVSISHHFQRDYKLPQLPETKYVYLTSLGEHDQPVFTEVIAQKQKLGFKLIFSPGTLQVTEPLSDIKEVLQHTDILILNKEEAKKLTRLNTDSNETLLKALSAFGPKQVVMTRSQYGSIGFEGENYIKVGALPVDVVESTGAGDTYAATVGASLAKGKDLKTAMELGALNAASVITQVGRINGLLNMSILEQKHTSAASQLAYVEP
jgi:ribokinase